MLIWTLINEKMATLQELETHWNLDDANRAYAVLQIKKDYINLQNKCKK